MSFDSFMSKFKNSEGKIKKIKNSIIAIDEAHNLFCPDKCSQISNDYEQLMKKRENCFLFLASGTPVRNNPFELYQILDMLDCGQNPIFEQTHTKAQFD